MKFEIFHQLGWNYNWNVDSYQNDKVGDGIIFAPKYMVRTTVENFTNDVKSSSIFDPQFFNPHEINERMRTYGFYPESLMPEGYNTDKFSNFSSICIEKCMNFQSTNDFRFFIIPTIYYKDAPPVEKFTDFQEKHFIKPSFETATNLKAKKGMILQLVLNSHMIKDSDYSNYLLNWITGLEGLNGIYLIVEPSSGLKQINDPDYLYSILKFVDAAVQNKLITILGYLNTEAILLSLADPHVITIGSHENLRIFNHLHFENYEEEPGIKQKTPWVFIPSMLDWIDFRLIQLLLKRSPEFKKYLGENKYSLEMLKPTYNPNSVKNRYYHYFLEGSKQLREISQLEGKERFVKVYNLIHVAIEERARIMRSTGVPFPGEGYLNQWLIAANSFASEKGWRE
jgi:hypothetical protein